MSTVSDSSRRLLKATEKTGGKLRKASSSRIATAAAFLIAAIWTIPTFGLLSPHSVKPTTSKPLVGGRPCPTRHLRWRTTRKRSSRATACRCPRRS